MSIATNGLHFQHLVEIGVDGASVILGKHKSVSAKIKIIITCTCTISHVVKNDWFALEEIL